MPDRSRRNFLFAASAAALAAQSPGKFRIAIIGTGHRAQAHIRALKSIPNVEIVALADITPQALDAAATLVGTQPALYSDYHKLLAEQKDLDAVAVVVPNFLHAEVAMAALAAGLNVLSEKPMATSVEDANRMIAAAEKSGRILQIGQQSRYRPVFEKLHALVEEGRIGPIEFASGNLFRTDWYAKSWKYPNPSTGVATNWRLLTHTAGSSLMEDGIHELDIFHWMIHSRIARVYATGGNNVFQERETIDHAAIAIDYENGVKLQFGFNLFGPAGPSGRLMIFLGKDGILEPDGASITVRGRGRGQPQVIETDAGPAGLDIGTRREYLAFVESVRSGKQPLCDGQAGKEAIKISLLAEKSLRERRIVTWDDLPG